MRRHTTLHCKMKHIVYPYEHCDARYNNYTALFDHNQQARSSDQTGSGKTHGVKARSRERRKSITFFLKRRKI